MSRLTDQAYLANEQYRDSSRLHARVSLHERFSENPQGWFPWVFDALDELPTSARFLELGCGQGNLWKDCAERIPTGWSITLSDFSPGMLQDAWRNLVVIGHGFKFEQIDAQSIPYPNETFDILIANHMLYHVPDRQQALAEIRRVLKPAGCLVAATIGKNHLKEMAAWFNLLGASMDFSTENNPFTLENGLEQLTPYFESVEIRRYADNLHVRALPPLLDYIQSSLNTGGVPPGMLEKLTGELEQTLQRQGEIFITKDTGLFLARK